MHKDISNKFNGKLGTYTYITTEDGSQTIHSSAFDENCHSTSGAYEETLYNYVDGCEIIQRLREYDKSEKFSIFEVGFGAGLGPVATLKSLVENGLQERRIEFVTTEIDPQMANFVINGDHFKKDFLYTMKRQDQNEIILSLHNFTLRILLGDARQEIQKLIREGYQAQAIFQDPFSPKKNPSLWTLEWFSDLRKICAKDVILSTYSSSMQARKAMIEAGFYIEKRTGFGKKRSATRAKLQPIKNQENILEEIKRNSILPFKDCDIQS